MTINTLKRKRYLYLFAAAISFLVLGLVYAWSLFATPLAEIYGWEMSAVKVTFTICMMAFCVGGLIGVRVLRRLGLCVFFNQGWLYVLGCLMMVMGYGSVAQQATAFARERYGQKRFPHHLAIVNTDIAGGSALQQVVMSTCGGVSLLIYTTMAILGAVAFATSLIFARITKPRGDARQSRAENNRK